MDASTIAFILSLIGLNRYQKPDRFNIDRFTNITTYNNVKSELVTETFWPMYGATGGVGIVVAWAWLGMMEKVMRISVHGLSTYLAVMSVLCFWGKFFFWGVALAIGGGLYSCMSCLYLIDDRLNFDSLDAILVEKEDCNRSRKQNLLNSTAETDDESFEYDIVENSAQCLDKERLELVDGSNISMATRDVITEGFLHVDETNKPLNCPD